jgi:serine/threonine protein kinase
VLYECLTGRLPFVAPSPAALIAKVLNEDPAEAVAAGEDTPAALSALIARLLAKEPEARPSSATELLSLLDQIG